MLDFIGFVADKALSSPAGFCSRTLLGSSITEPQQSSGLQSHPDKLYIREFETKLAVAENTIHEAEEAFHYLRQDYYNLREHANILEDCHAYQYLKTI